MVERQIPLHQAEELLKDLIEAEIVGLKLSSAQRSFLKKVGEKGSARSGDYKAYGRKSGQDFSSNFLVGFYKMRLLTRTQEGTIVSYSLRGTAALAAEYNLL